MKVYRALVVWVLWVAAALFFAYATYYAPSGQAGSLPTAPELFFFVLGCAHIFFGGLLLVDTFIKDNPDSFRNE